MAASWVVPGMGDRIRKIREAQGYTREQLAELCDLSPRFLANVELGESNLGLKPLIRFCEEMVAPADYILMDRDPLVQDDVWAPTINMLRHLNPEYQAYIDRMILDMVRYMNHVKMSDQ